jgi:hypothetical protein
MVGPGAKRETVANLRNVLQMSERRACTIVAADRKMIRYRSRRPPMSNCAPVYVSSPTSAAGSATGGCSSCCGNRASHQASTASIGSTERKGGQSASARLGGEP